MYFFTEGDGDKNVLWTNQTLFYKYVPNLYKKLERANDKNDSREIAVNIAPNDRELVRAPMLFHF